MSQTPSLNLCFFWHMHQPDYRDASGVMQMPWVFLHAIKDYYEMPWLLSRHKGLKATFNITPPLIEQLLLYKEPLKNDYFLSLWHKHPSELEEEQRTWLIKTCKSTQYETMIKPIPHLEKLYHDALGDDQDLIDFELLFMLTWCGNYLRLENALIGALFEKGKGFTQEDKEVLLKELTDFVGTILPYYAHLQKEGVIALSTTPYNHPILPLLLDMQNAKRANPYTTVVEEPLCLREDAIEQVERSIALYKETFGVAPKGFWPAEGAVDEESVGIYKERGISWIATDEAILFRSLESDHREALYKAYQHNGVSIGFRDHGLSDLIGFTYRFKSGEEASRHFMGAIEPIRHMQKDATVFVILDGENAWEFFENNAYDFFTSLYEGLEESKWCQTVTMDEVSQMSQQVPLPQLAPGSWIHGNFDTWSGHAEKNRAWELIYQTKRDVEVHLKALSDEVAKSVKFHFLASECSDWFWWYGDDHSTEFAAEFDTLFREHLITIYQLVGLTPPTALFIPIISHKESEAFEVKPTSMISPHIDGKRETYFEWLGAGSIDETKLYSTMDRVRGPIELISYGQNAEAIFIAFDGEINALKQEGVSLEISMSGSEKGFSFDLLHPQTLEGVTFAMEERIELSIAKSQLPSSQTLQLRFEMVHGTEILQSMPGLGALVIDLTEVYHSEWFV